MKRALFLLPMLLLFCLSNSKISAQVYYETVGTGSSESIVAYTGWDNQDNPNITYAEEEPFYNTKIGTPNDAQDYEGASGGSAIWVGGGGGSFTINGINTSGYTELTMTLGMQINSGNPELFVLEYSDDNGDTWQTLTMNNINSWSWSIVTVNNIPIAENLSLRWTNNEDLGWKTLYMDDIRIFDPTDPQPTVNITGELNDFGDMIVDAKSTPQSYQVAGHTLNEDIVITPSDGFEISLTDNSGFSTNSLTLQHSGGVVSETTIYVRFAPTEAKNYSGTVSNVSSGSNSPVLNVSGTGIAPTPYISLFGEINNFGNQPIGTSSNEQSYSVEGIHLEGDISIAAPAGFEISETSGSGFTSAITLTPTSQSVTADIYVRFNPGIETTYSDNITHLSTNSNNPDLLVEGTGITSDPTIIVGNVNNFGNQTVNTSSAEQTYTLEAYNLSNDLTITPPEGFEISQNSGAAFVAEDPLVLSPDNGTISPTNIYVRFSPTQEKTYSGNLSHTSGTLTENIALSGIGTIQQIHRARIVDFGNDHGEGYYRDKSTNKHPEVQIDVDGDGDASNDGVAFWEYSYSDPMSPSPIHFDRQATSSIFHGGITAFFNKPGYGITEGLINENHELRDDHNFMVVNTDNSVQRKGWGLWFWKKEYFLNGGDTSINKVSFDENSLLAVHISRYWNGIQGGRFVVQDGEQFYISEYVFTDALRSTQTLVPTQSRWAEYNPDEPYHVRFDPEGASFSNHTFTDVSAVGFYLFDDILDAENIQIKWHSFEAWANIERDPTPGYYSEVYDADLVEIPSGSGFDNFYISQTEIPYQLWQKVYKWAVSNQFCFDIPNSRGYVFDRDGDMGSMDLNNETHSASEPATDMTWYDAVLWCNALSEMEGFEPCYYADAAKTQRLKEIKGRDNPTDYDKTYKVYVDWDANGYRLPTMAEWTYAAAAGNTNPWTGNKTKTNSIATSDINSLGLYDMTGNVWEYTWDIPNAGDLFDPATQNNHTVLGGGFVTLDTPQNAILPYGEIPFTGNYNIGFRVVRAVGGVTPPTNQETGSMPVWTFEKDQILAPETPTSPNTSLVADDLIYLSGNKTFGKEGTDSFEDDNVGYTRSDEAKITITPYYASKYEINYQKWNEVYQWAVNNGYEFDRDGDMGSMDWSVGEFSHSANEPVTDVGWNDVALWCNALSEYEGLTPVYYADTTGENVVLRQANQWRIRMENRTESGYHTDKTTQFMTIIADYSKDGYRLPTESEWDYLFRDGDESQNFKTPDWVNSEWLEDNANGQSQEIGTAPAGSSDFGFYDLGGNVEEWVWDWLGRSYYVAHNPKGSSKPDGLFGKVVKGRSFGSHALSGYERSYRQERESAARPYLGFRVVRCDAGEHPQKEEFTPNVVLDFNPEDYDPLTGKTFRNNLHRTGAFDKTGVPEGPVSEKWSFQTGGAVQSSPVLVEGVIYIGSMDGYVYALNAATGNEIWKYNTSSKVSASATIHNDILYIGDENGFFHAIYTKGENAGTRKWRIRQTAQGKVTNTASVVYNTVFASWTGWANESRATGFDLNGNEVWRFRTSRVNGGPAAMAIDTFTFYQPASDNLFIAGDLATEIRKWKGMGIHGYNCTPIANEKSILYADEFEIYKASRSTGSRQWAFRNGNNTDKNQLSSPAVGTVTIDSQDKDITVFAQLSGDIWGLDLGTGNEIWHNTDAAGAYESSPSLANNVVYIGNNDGFLYAIDAEDGTKIWDFNTGDVVFSTPLPDDGTVFVGSDDGKVYALFNAAVNSKPTIDNIANVNVDVNNTQEQEVLLTGISDGDDGSQSLTISAVSSKTDIVTNVNVTDNGDGTALLQFTPQGVAGEAEIGVTVTDDGSQNNTIIVSFIVKVDTATGIRELKSDIVSYPNPVKDKLNLELKQDAFRRIIVSDMRGQILHSDIIPGMQKRHVLDISHLAKGLYLINVKGQKSSYKLRIIVQ